MREPQSQTSRAGKVVDTELQTFLCLLQVGNRRPYFFDFRYRGSTTFGTNPSDHVLILGCQAGKLTLSRRLRVRHDTSRHRQSSISPLFDILCGENLCFQDNGISPSIHTSCYKGSLVRAEYEKGGTPPAAISPPRSPYLSPRYQNRFGYHFTPP
jgi:hypothetical protein